MGIGAQPLKILGAQKIPENRAPVQNMCAPSSATIKAGIKQRLDAFFHQLHHRAVIQRAGLLLDLWQVLRLQIFSRT